MAGAAEEGTLRDGRCCSVEHDVSRIGRRVGDLDAAVNHGSGREAINDVDQRPRIGAGRDRGVDEPDTDAAGGRRAGRVGCCGG